MPEGFAKPPTPLEIKALPDAPEPQRDQIVEVTKELPKTKCKARRAVEAQSTRFDL